LHQDFYIPKQALNADPVSTSALTTQFEFPLYEFGGYPWLWPLP